MSKGSSLPHLPLAVSPMMMMSRLLIIIMGPEQMMTAAGAARAARASQAVHVRDVSCCAFFSINQTPNLLLLRLFTPTPNV